MSQTTGEMPTGTGLLPSSIPTGNSTLTGGRLFYLCKEVSATCPVKATTLGYYPNRPANIFFTVTFALAAVIALFGGWRKKTWSYSLFIFAGCVLEMAGYVGRVLMADNPWNSDAFQLQICAIVLAPTLICISVYLTLKHMCETINPTLSRLPPRLYPLIFVPADVSCLVIQAIGGGLAASGGAKNFQMTQNGNRMIIAGICLQVVVLLFFGVAMGQYYLATRKWVRSGQATPEGMAIWKNRNFRIFAFAVGGAYMALLIRCVYRIAEMAGGWGNHIMQHEETFIVFDSVMVLLSVVLLAVFSPGFWFPQMAEKMAAGGGMKGWCGKRKRGEKTTASPVEGTTMEDLPSSKEDESTDGSRRV